MHPLAILQLLVLLLVANGAPVITRMILGQRLAHPLYGGIRFLDRQPLFGTSKTLRGVLSSIVATAAFAPVVGLEWKLGAIIGSTAMAGDLLSSFVKRRLRLAPSSRATGLDQVPESLLPFLACRSMLTLTAADILAGVVIFFIGEVVLSRLLYKLGIRRRPY